MQKTEIHILSFFFLLSVFSSCAYERMSFGKPQGNTGMNGGFESTKEDFPVNWALYGVKAFKKGHYQIYMDKESYTEGKQFLCFVIDSVDQRHWVWTKPGLFQTYWAKPGEQYQVSFKYKNINSHFKVRIGSEKSKGAYEEAILDTEQDCLAWKEVTYLYTVPDEFETIRFELNFYTPGKFWIDDIKIQGVNDKKERRLWGIWLGM
jgi:hypothetical protein